MNMEQYKTIKLYSHGQVQNIVQYKDNIAINIITTINTIC
jgi:hypothetical protein